MNLRFSLLLMITGMLILLITSVCEFLFYTFSGTVIPFLSITFLISMIIYLLRHLYYAYFR